MTGSERIAAERQRQIEVEGYDAAHDRNAVAQLALAGVCYALPENVREGGLLRNALWPWADRFWKPTPDDRIRELTKAGALIAAAIDSLIVEDVL